MNLPGHLLRLGAIGLAVAFGVTVTLMPNARAQDAGGDEAGAGDGGASDAGAGDAGAGDGGKVRAAAVNARASDGGTVGAGGPADAGAETTASCVEHLPKGARRPKLTVSFPKRGLSGYEARLTVVITHGAGETVLPEGFKLQRGSEAAEAIRAAGFAIPEPDGGSAPTAETTSKKIQSQTTLTIPFVALPPEPGRHVLILPPIPVSVARANGELTTVCTEPQRITIDDPIANETDPQVKPNPPPRPQREPWDLAKYVTIGIAVGLVIAVLAFWLIRRWLRRPKVIPAPPPVLPWIAAMTELDRLRASRLLEQQKNDEFYDQVDDCIRKYLGDRYGFDGLESTSEEIRFVLGRVLPPPPELGRIWRFMEDSDFIKFADVRPSKDECRDALNKAVDIVRLTTPTPVSKPPASKAPKSSRRAA